MESPPNLPGMRLRAQEPLAAHSTLRIGGPAEWFAELETEAALRSLLRWARSQALPLTVLGLGSNVLFPDEGLEGLVVRLTGNLARVRIRGRWVQAGAGAVLAQVARATVRRGLGGLEALAGFPSSVGGAVFMNAGCYGSEISDVARRVVLLDDNGTISRRRMEDLRPSYRKTRLQEEGGVVLRVLFELRPGQDPGALEQRMRELNARRWQSLPSGLPNAGSIFKNPPGDSAGRLIEAAGLKGFRVGDAEISHRHANVLVNRGRARAQDALLVLERAREEVASRFGVLLEPEIQLLGSLRLRWRQGIPAPTPIATPGAAHRASD